MNQSMTRVCKELLGQLKKDPFQQLGPSKDQVLNSGPFCKHCFCSKLVEASSFGHRLTRVEESVAKRRTLPLGARRGIAAKTCTRRKAPPRRASRRPRRRSRAACRCRGPTSAAGPCRGSCPGSCTGATACCGCSSGVISPPTPLEVERSESPRPFLDACRGNRPISLQPRCSRGRVWS